MGDEIRFIPPGYRICAHGIKTSYSQVDGFRDLLTIRFTEESHVLGPGEVCMVPMERERSQ